MGSMTQPAPAFLFSPLANYLELGIGRVQGWLQPTTASVIGHLLVHQASAGLRGDVCEIGVHHGKLFLILANGTVVGERAVAVDVFDDQDKNVDGSGSGDREIFERHLATYSPSASVEIIQESSLDLERLGFLSRRFRFVSIDGGHTASITANDLRLAERTMLEGGVVAVDDILSHDWTGVLSGVSTYLAEGGTLVPFALVPNKLLLTTDADAAARGRALLRRSFPLALSKQELEFLGGEVDSYNEQPYYSREANAGLRRALDDLYGQRELLASQLAAAHAEAARARAEAASLRASTSWRMTAPFRALSKAVRRTG